MKLIFRIARLFLAVAILLSSIVFQPVNSYASTEEEELLVLIKEKTLFLEMHSFGSLYEYDYDFNLQLGGAESFWKYYQVRSVRSVYQADKEPLSYEDLKKLFLECTTPLGFMLYVPNSILNINGAAYVKDRDGVPFGQGGFYINEVKILDKNEDAIYTHCRSFYSDGNLFQEYYILLQKVNDSWNISWISHAFGLDPSATTEQIEAVFSGYIEQTILSYIVSENINCGYEKFSQEVDLWGNTPMEIIVEFFDAVACTGKAHTIIDEYDENGNVISQHKIVVEIGENLSEKVTDIDLSNVNPDTADVDLVFIVLAVIFGTAGLFLLKKKPNLTM